MSDFEDYDLNFQSDPELEFGRRRGTDWEDTAEDAEEEEAIEMALEAARALREEQAEQRRIQKLYRENPSNPELDTLRPIRTEADLEREFKRFNEVASDVMEISSLRAVGLNRCPEWTALIAAVLNIIINAPGGPPSVKSIIISAPGNAELNILRSIKLTRISKKTHHEGRCHMVEKHELPAGKLWGVQNGSGHYIHLSEPIMKKKPRVEIIGILLHWLLHLWIQLHMKNPPMDEKKKRHKHQFHLEWVEARVDIEIPISHNVYAKDAAELRVHRWHCTRCGRTYSSARNMAPSKLKDDGKGRSPYAAWHKKKYHGPSYLWIQLHMKKPPMDEKKKRHKHQFHSALEWVEVRVNIDILISHMRLREGRCRVARSYLSAWNMAHEKLKAEGKGILFPFGFLRFISIKQIWYPPASNLKHRPKPWQMDFATFTPLRPCHPSAHCPLGARCRGADPVSLIQEAWHVPFPQRGNLAANIAGVIQGDTHYQEEGEEDEDEAPIPGEAELIGCEMEGCTVVPFQCICDECGLYLCLQHG
ncbi:uncharacterized protein EV422DRAFT_507359 [Fimicolochytrium jonesii]|uniref:uncharacterized protein n=1 Tax=Fimicolochytrium jonesii TaxID=1396493 RepID=UPI0022FEE885|nr:uncharacterized protein EV422DRAFT_507359 [Fimicolochytrium jonesii]KAI8819739.1 hypothetical protein EV422DRAFT_507359 [Fimicolochytrium jonesii]